MLVIMSILILLLILIGTSVILIAIYGSKRETEEEKVIYLDDVKDKERQN